jgi:hypothetical protein
MSVGSADLAGLQAGATPALPPAVGRGAAGGGCGDSLTDQRLIGVQSWSMPLVSGWRALPRASSSDLIPRLDCHLLSNVRVRFATNCD